VELKFQLLYSDAKVPRRWTNGAVGYDLHAYIKTESGRASKVLVPPRTTINVSTGLLVELPPSHFGMVVPRSGLGKLSVSVTNSPGIIDPDYRGEIRVLIYNGGLQNYWVEHETRIAQLVLVPVTQVAISVVDQLSETQRGRDGFGSTGD
jgi:dUTP pyrophosphatase